MLDSERALARQGTTLVGSAKSALLVDVVSRGGLIQEVAAAARAHVRRRLAQHVGRWSAQSAGIVTAIVIGDRTGLAPDLERRLQEAGTYHVIAISGGNIAILTGLLLGIFRIAGWLNRVAMLTSILGLTGYALIVGEGGGRSVERATLMASIQTLEGRARIRRVAETQLGMRVPTAEDLVTLRRRPESRVKPRPVNMAVAEVR